MAGLLDNSTDLTSLLSQFQPTQGDMENARRQAQMQFFLGLLGAPKGGEFQRVGQSGLLAMQGYNDALANQQKALMERMQAAGMAMNIREQQQKFADLDAQRQAMGSIVSPQGVPQPGTLTGAATQASTGTPSLYERLNAIADQLEAQAAKLKSPAVAQMAMKYREEAAKYAPKYKGMETVMQDGKPVLLQTFDNQAPQPMQGFQPKPDYKSVDTGSQVGFYDPLTGQQSGTFTKSMTPGEQASNSLGYARLGEEQRHNRTSEGFAQTNQDIRRAEVDPLGFLGINKNGIVGQQGQRVEYSPTLSPQELAAAQADARKSGYTQGGPSIAGAIASDVHGEDFLKTLPDSLSAQVKGLATGSIPFPSSFALKSPYWQGMISLVTQYDPSFDAVNYGARAKTRNAFTAGKEAQQVNALNTVIGHLGQLSDAADALKNTALPMYNTVANYLATATGDPRVKTFDATKKAVVDELTRVYRGTGGSEADIKTWSSAINAANSPEQIHAVIAQIGGLLESKIQALNDQYEKGMGTTAQGLQLLTPHARAALDTMERRAGVRATGGWSAMEVK